MEVKIIKFLYKWLSIYLIAISLLFLAARTMVVLDKESKLACMYVLFSETENILLTNDNLKTNTFLNKIASSFFRFDSNYYFSAIDKETDNQQLSKYRKSLHQIDPWQLFFQSNLDYYFLTNQLDEAKSDLYKMKSLIQSPVVVSSDYPEYTNQVAEGFMKLANKYLNSDIQAMIEATNLAKETNPWIFTYLPPNISALSTQNKYKFIVNVDENRDEYWGQDFSQYKDSLWEVYTYQLNNPNRDGNTKVIAHKLYKSKVDNAYFWDITSQVFSRDIDTFLQKGELKKAQEVVEDWFEVWQVLEKERYGINVLYQKDLERKLVKIANMSIGNKMYIVGENYRKAKKINSVALYENRIWLEDTDVFEVDRLEAMSYFDSIYGLKEEEIGWKYKLHAELTLVAILEEIEMGHFDNTEKYYDYYLTLNYFDQKTVDKFKQKAKQLELNPELEKFMERFD